MKKFLTAFLLISPIIFFGQNASIEINIKRVTGEIDPNIYGVFMEPIQLNRPAPGSKDTLRFNTMYGTLYDPASPLANKDGFKTNHIEAMRELQITNMRWPGGNFVAGYNWQDGIGPKDQRPIRKDLAWGAIETNQVGTDEWVALNKAIGSANVVAINLGLGTINDARYWVEYCNLPPGTTYSNLRKQYGHPEPYHIKYWCLGNEVDGEPWIMGHKDADDYCKIAIEAAKAMRNTDPDIKLVANGSSYYEPTGKWIEWNRKVITALTGMADYLSIHRYWDRAADYYDYVGQSSMDIEDKIRTVQAQVDVIKDLYPDKTPLKLSVDEWAPFGQTMLTTMAVAEYLNSFIRHSDFVKMANYTLMTSLLANDPKKGTFKSPLFYTFKAFSTNCRGVTVDSWVQCDTFNTDKYKGIPYLDVTAVYQPETHTAYINVVNRHQEQTISTDIVSNTDSFDGTAEIALINVKDSVDASFSYDLRESYLPSITTASVQKGKISCRFPPHSFTQIKVKMK